MCNVALTSHLISSSYIKAPASTSIVSSSLVVVLVTLPWLQAMVESLKSVFDNGNVIFMEYAVGFTLPTPMFLRRIVKFKMSPASNFPSLWDRNEKVKNGSGRKLRNVGYI